MNALAKREKDEIMVQLTFLPEELRCIPDGSDFEECIEYAKKIAVFVNGTDLEGRYVWGKTFKNIKKKLGHGKWLEACAILGINKTKIERCMKIAEGFDHDPSQLEGLTQQKALYIASRPEEEHRAFMEKEIVYDIYGNPCPIADFRVMAWREFQSERKELKSEKSKWKDQALNLGDELESTIKQAEGIRKTLEQMRKDADASMAEQIKALEDMLVEKDATINAIELQLRELREEKFEKEIIRESIKEAEIAVMKCIVKFNNLKPGENPSDNNDVCGEMYKFIQWAQKLVRLLKLGENNTYFDTE